MDYDSCFLEYLNQYFPVTFYNPGGSDNPEFMDAMIEMFTREFGTLYQHMSQLRKIQPPVIHTKCICNDTINAFCFWHPIQNFCGVAVHSGTFSSLYEQLSVFAHDPRLKDIPYLNTIFPEDLTKQLYIYALQFIGKHEYMHIILGHCRFIQEKGLGLYIGEHSLTDKDFQKNLHSQAMERLADVYTAKDSIEQILYLSDYQTEKIKTNLLIYYLSVLHIFSLFHSGEYYDWNSPDILNDLLSTDHPAVSMRLYYIAEAIDESLLNHYKRKGFENAADIVEDIDQIINTVFEISRLFHDTFQMELIYPSYSEAGIRYNVRLYNAMPAVISACESVALFHPLNYTPVDEDTAVYEMQAIIQTLLPG